MKTLTFYKSPEYKDRIQKVYDKALERWPEPCTESYIDTRHGKTFIISSGKKSDPVMILLHGSGSSSYMWLNDVSLYNRTHYVHAIDIPGDAGKSEEIRASWDNNDFVEWMEDIYKALSISSATIVGISLGGWIGVKWAVNFPERVDRLILLCASGIVRPRIVSLLRIVFFSFLGDYGIKKVEEAIFNSKNIHPDVSSFFRLMSEGFLPRMGVPPLFSDDELRKLTMPVLFLGGDKDVLIDIESSIDRIEKLIPHAKILYLENTGHAITGASKYILNNL